MFAEDWDAYFNADELGDLCTVAGVDVVGVFTQEGDEVEGVETYVPVLIVPADNVPGVAHGTAVVCPKGGQAFQVREITPDETGRVLTLILEEV